MKAIRHPAGAPAESRPLRNGRPSNSHGSTGPDAGQNGHGQAGRGRAKQLNPDARSKAKPGMVESDRGQRSDEQLIQDYQHGDRSSFAELIGRYERELFHFLVRFMNDRAAAEDVFQETFLQVHQSAKTFQTDRRFKPWLFTIAANKARDLRRANSRRPAVPLQASIGGNGADEGGEYVDLMKSSDELPDLPLLKKELREKVEATVRTMPEGLREILLLSYFQQFPYKQIGDILDIPLGTVKSRLHTAVAYFADLWKATNYGTLLS